MIKINKGEDDWEECILCMEPTNYWLCCDQRKCSKCNARQKLTSRGERRCCPFCRTPEIYQNEPKFESQLLFWAEKVKHMGSMYFRRYIS